jgi:DNA polymerase-3 subunit epsilon
VRSSRLGRKLALSVLLLFLVPTILAGAVLAQLYRGGSLADPTALTVAVAVGFVTMMLYLGLVTYALGQTVVRTLQEIQLGTELMATVNPAHRLGVHTGDELQTLAEEINRMADRLRDGRDGLAAQVAEATTGLQLERAKLSAVLQTLGEGVVVATADGRVLLANPAAQERLGAGSAGVLGRSLFDFVDRGKVGHFAARLQASGGVSERFGLHLPDGVVLDTVMTPFADSDGRLLGFVLVLRDVTSPVRSEQARQRALEQALRDARGPLSSIRSLSESLLAEGVLPDGPRTLLTAIHDESLRLAGLLRDQAEPASRGPAPAGFETIAVSDLATMVLERLPQAGAAVDRLQVDAGPPDLRLQAETSALSGALAHLLTVVLRQRQGGGVAWLRAAGRGRVIQLDAGAEGRLPPEAIAGQLDAPLGAKPGSVSTRDVVREHAGEAWVYADPDRFGFRISIPAAAELTAMAPAPARLAGAGLRSGQGPGEPGGRPVFYDFSLLEAMEQRLAPADRERRLAELDCVVLDTETTGLEPDRGDRIVSLAAVRVRRGAVKRGEVFDALVNPRRPIPADSVRFHGITDAMVADKPPLDVILAEFLRFADGAVLVGHQVWFDLRFLGLEATRLGLPPLTDAHAVLDTLPLSEVVHGPLEGHDLDAVAGRFGVVVQGRHSALGDALTTAEIFVRLVELLGKRGVLTLGQALESVRRTGRGSAAGRPRSGP